MGEMRMMEDEYEVEVDGRGGEIPRVCTCVRACVNYFMNF